MSEEEKKAIWYFSEVLTYEEDIEQWKVIEHLIEEQQNKIASQEKQIKLMKSININDNYISKDKIREKQIEREFELQQEYKDFEDDIQWKTYKKLLEE